MSISLFAYPRQAEFNRVLPKTKIYEHSRAGRAIRERFVEEVDQIVWKFKLAPETINLPASPGVPEIQVFHLALRSGELNESVLRTIDRAIPFPIFFELAFGGQIRSVAAFKRSSDADSAKWVVDAYFETPWLPSEHARSPLPVALDMAGLYEQLLRRHITLPARPGESLKAQVERAHAIRVKETECRRLESRLRKEVQFNRKVELNRELRVTQQELDGLLGQADYKETDASWKS